MDSRAMEQTNQLITYLRRQGIALYSVASGLMILARPDNNVTAFMAGFFNIADYVTLVSIWAVVMIAVGILGMAVRRPLPALKVIVALPLALFLMTTAIAIVQNPRSALSNSLNAGVGLLLIFSQLARWGHDDEP